MNSIFILREIAGNDRKIWKVFSLLNKEFWLYFNRNSWNYELCFRTIERGGRRICYKLDGQAHRTDGPAMIWKDGTEFWYKNGKKHRTSVNGIHVCDGPAVTYRNNYKVYYEGDNKYKLDNKTGIKSIIIFNDGDEEWWQNGKLHRASVNGICACDGPARIIDKDTKFWYNNDKLHRIDGPAVINKKDRDFWEEYASCYRVFGNMRIDGPDFIYKHKGEYWFDNGRLHRIGGPAVKFENGDEEWYKEGKIHRINGPAVTWKNGNGEVIEEYWIEGEEVEKIKED